MSLCLYKGKRELHLRYFKPFGCAERADSMYIISMISLNLSHGFLSLIEYEVTEAQRVKTSTCIGFDVLN